MRWTRTDSRYAIATVIACAVAAWLTLGAFGFGPSPLPRVADDRTPRLAGLTIGEVAPPPPSPGSESPTFEVQPPILDPQPQPTPPSAADTRPPDVQIATEDGAVLVGIPGPTSVTGVASDTGSGVAAIVVTFIPRAGAETTVRAEADCADRSCRWLAHVPGPGTYEVTATATDRAGNTSDPAGPITITVVQTATGTSSGSSSEDDAGLSELINRLTSIVGL